MSTEGEASSPRWPGRVAVGILNGDVPSVFIADSVDVLGRLLAIELVAKTDPSSLVSRGKLEEIREALLDERWADALTAWMEATGNSVDAYPDEVLWTEARLGSEHASFEIRLAPIFNEPESREGDT